MKKKRNIIKRILPCKNKFILFSKKLIRSNFKKKFFKKKNFLILLSTMNSFKYIYYLNKYFKYNILRIKDSLIIVNNIYLNYLTNDLDLKYKSKTYQNLNNIYLNNFLSKKLMYSLDNNLEIDKIYKFITIIDSKTINYLPQDIILNDFFFINIYIYMSFLYNYYILNFKIIISIIN